MLLPAFEVQKKKMKITMICNLPPSYGGAESFAKTLALQWQRDGMKVSLVTHDLFEIQLVDGMEIKQYPFEETHHEDLRQAGIEVYPLFRSSLVKRNGKTATHQELFEQQLEDLLRLKAPDVVHCHFTTGKMKEVKRVCEKLEIPIVLTLHGMTNLKPMYDSFVFSDSEESEHFSLLESNTHNVVVSRPMLEYCQEKGLSNVSWIPGGIDTEFFSPSDCETREGIVYVGKLNEHKGLKQTVEAFLKVHTQIPDSLYLVGRGTDLETFEKTHFFLDKAERLWVQDLMKEKRIFLMGELWPEELRELYRKSRLLVLPSLTEGLPLSILEALACNTPVIASSIGSIPEVLHEGDNGYLIEKGNANHLARAIRKALRNHKQLQEGCRASVRNYAIQKISKRYQALFERLPTPVRTS